MLISIKMTMGHEQLTPEQFQQILVNEYGIIFFPKRPLEAPNITREILMGKVKSRRENTALQDINGLKEFLSMPAIGDRFDDNHRMRVEWIGFIMEKYGKTAKDFIAAYAENNQFRLNKLMVAQMTLYNISEKVISPLGQKFLAASGTLFDYLDGASTGEPYGEIKDIQKKLQIVHTF